MLFNDLFMKSISDTLDMASYNSDKFLLSVTTVPKETVKIQVLTMENPYWKLLTDYEVLMPMLWSRDLSELWSSTYERLKRRCYSVRKQFEDFPWINLWLPITCYVCQGFVFVFVLFFFYFFNNTLSWFCSTIRFCYRIKIFNHFIGAEHEATETFVHCLLNKTFSKVSLSFSWVIIWLQNII